MNRIQTIGNWLEDLGYEVVFASKGKIDTILFYPKTTDKDCAKRVIYALSIFDALCHIGNISYIGQNLEIGYYNAIRITDITPEILLDNILNITEDIKDKENTDYYDTLMYKSQKFDDVVSLIKQFSLCNNYSILKAKSKKAKSK